MQIANIQPLNQVSFKNNDTFKKLTEASPKVPRVVPFEAKFTMLQNFLLHKKIKEYQKNLDSMNQDFYSTTRDFQDIKAFETNKELISRSIRTIKHPQNPMYVTERKDPSADINELRCILYNALNSGISKASLYSCTDIDKFFPHSVLLPRMHKLAGDIYYSQSEIQNLDLDEIRASMTPLVEEVTFVDQLELASELKEENKEFVRLTLLHNVSNFSLDKPLIRHYKEKGDFYDLPYKLALATASQLEKTGEPYIIDSIPEIFKGIDKKELFSSLDTLSSILRMEEDYEDLAMKPGHFKTFKIAGEGFRATCLGNGGESFTFRITKDNSNSTPVAFKVFCNPNRIGSSEAFGSIAIHREAQKNYCSDIPKFMMANPTANYYTSDNGSLYCGAWEIVEDVSEKKLLNNPRPFIKWLEQYNLKHHDYNGSHNHHESGYIVDFGYIGTQDIKFRDFATYSATSNYYVNELFEQFFEGVQTVKGFVQTLIKSK